MAKFDSALFDGFLFDTEADGGGGGSDVAEVKIGSLSLQSTSIATRWIKYSAPRLDLVARSYARADGGYAETEQFRETRFRLRGTVKAATRIALEELMDQMRAAFAATPATLRVTWGGVFRYWDVYATGMDRLFEGRDHFHVTFSPWEIELVCLQPYGRSSGRETFAGGNATAASTTFQIPNNGTAPTPSIVELTISTAGTLEDLSWENQDTGERITIENGGAFNDGDTIVINTEDKTVKKNGSVINYTGLLPTLISGTNDCVLTAITGTGHTVAVNERHYKRYY